MRRLNILQFIICIFILSAGVSINSAHAQMPRRGGDQIAVTGWADDTHYLFRSLNENENLVTKSVDVETAKGVAFTPEVSGRDLIATLLPEGTLLTMNDVLSPDSKMVQQLFLCVMRQIICGLSISSGNNYSFGNIE